MITNTNTDEKEVLLILLFHILNANVFNISGHKQSPHPKRNCRKMSIDNERKKNYEKNGINNSVLDGCRRIKGTRLPVAG